MEMLDELTYQQDSTGVASTAERRTARADRRAGALIRRVAVLGNHLPRHCGLATFTTHLAGALADVSPSIDCLVLAVNDPGKRHAYPARVRFEIAEADVASYRRGADYLNVNGVDLVSVQHEFGIFGGSAGSHLLLLLRELRMPIVTTLHTILSEPSQPQRRVIEELAHLSERLVVMSAHGARVLTSCYGVPDEQIDVIPHGIPQVPATTESKSRLGVGGRTVILTFGLLSADKGIEYVIEALPTIVADHPEVIYIVLGATHPHVKDRHGEAYRVMLETRARQLGVDSHVIFHDRFVSQEELNEFLGATDIYITPYLNPEQSTSGTLAYALGSGRAVISTPYVYARELLADDRGVLVPFRDPAAISAAVTALVGDARLREALRDRAARHGRGMLWPAVARQYLATFERGAREQATRARATFQAQTLASRLTTGLPEVSLRHVQTLTDDTGLLQHATFCVPRYSEGYCLDDNARALLLMARLEEAGTEETDQVRALATRYLAFVHAAFDPARGRFRNFLSYSRTWVEPAGSEDSHGRALQALGTVVGRSSGPGRSLASELFHAALPMVRDFTSPRAWATTLLGLDEYLRAFEGDRKVQELRVSLAERLLDLYVRANTPEWPWFEDQLTYANAQLPHALIISGARMNRRDLVSVGLESLAWLLSVQRTADHHFAPVGTNGYSAKRAKPALFDQQPIEASTTVAACLEAERVASDRVWSERARTAFDWFLGQNHLGQWVYDASTGGCRDGLHAERANENQGAESTLAFLLALVDMRELDQSDVTRAGRDKRS
jgi:glycosyltransferase involved in cell wall biosynthesis